MNNNAIRVPEDKIQEFRSTVESMLTNRPSPGEASRSGLGNYSLSAATKKRDEHASLDTAVRDGTRGLLSRERHGVLVDALRAGMIAMAVADLFATACGYDPLVERKNYRGLSGEDDKRFHEILAARGIVSGFVAAAYLTTRYQARSDDAEPAPMATDAETPREAVSQVLSRLGVAISGVPDERLEGEVGLAATRMMRGFADNAPVGMARDMPAFEALTYKVETGDFTVNGFSPPSSRIARPKIEIQFKTPNEVVGNHVAKSQALRLSRMLACYDPEMRRNPFVELGGFIFTVMGDGFPGTGKTTLIQMAAGLTQDACDFAGVPFHYENFGIDQISEYQGKSGQNAKAFIERVLDPRSVGFGTIDDIDQVAGKRDDARSSGGQQEVTAVLMDAFAGAGTIVRGNCSFAMFSNYPENVDDALRQRAGARWLVDGPQSREDYIDIFALLVGKNHEIPLGDHDLGAGQDLKRLVRDAYDANDRPQDARLMAVFDRFHADNGELASLADIGTYLHAIREAEPRFTGRAIKNIADAVKLRAMDFDLPDQWFEDRGAFFDRPYAERLKMIGDLRQTITVPMVRQEINRYADSEFRYSAKSDDAAIEKIVREAKITVKARKAIGNRTDEWAEEMANEASR